MRSTPEYSLPLRILIAGRTAVAIVGLFAPHIFARIFRVDTAGTPAIALGRMFAVRNAALAAGLWRLDTFNSPRTFLKTNILIDLTDAVALIIARRRGEIGTPTLIMGTTTALAATAYGAGALAGVADA